LSHLTKFGKIPEIAEHQFGTIKRQLDSTFTFYNYIFNPIFLKHYMKRNIKIFTILA